MGQTLNHNTRRFPRSRTHAALHIVLAVLLIGGFIPVSSAQGYPPVFQQRSSSLEKASPPVGARQEQTPAENPGTLSLSSAGVERPTADGCFKNYLPLVSNGAVRAVVSSSGSGTQVGLGLDALQCPPPDPADVAPPLDRSAATDLFTATEFLYTGDDPIQTGVAPGTIDPLRVAVLRGKLLTRNGQPAWGAIITILDHPEYGQTSSRIDGMFDMVVNGGNTLTVHFEKAGYLSAQRQVEAPRQDYAWLPDVALIPLDAQVTTIDLSSSTSMQVAQGSIISDTDGSRQATLLVPQGTRAEVVLPGGITQTLTSLSVRATEYTVGNTGPEAMPAELPPQSGYTYAVEYSVDQARAAGATDVRFNQPLIHYVQNFLNFPVGMAVPVGYYDREKAIWVPSDNGRVVKILRIANGLADLDTDGDGAVDNGAVLTPTLVLTITVAERQRLASLYSSGQSLWRVPITHFTPWDCNWPYGPPPDAQSPQQPSPDTGQTTDDPCLQPGASIIECENQTLREKVGIVGTSFSLNYASDRVEGRKAANSLDIPLSGAALPASLKRIDLEVQVAGRRFEQSFSAAPNQSQVFSWDGQDVYGRPWQGAVPISVQIGYVYDGVYQQPSQFGQAFGGVSGVPITGNRARQEVTLWQTWQGHVGSLNAQPLGLGAWTFNVQHAYDPAGRILYLGDGSRRSESSANTTITTVAGNGTYGYSGDGGPATQARLSEPGGVAIGPDGSLFIADWDNGRIRRVGPDGIIVTVRSGLWYPADVVVMPDGGFYIANNGNHRVLYVRPDGVMIVAAGNATAGYSGDGGPATQAKLNDLRGIAVGPDGSLYIADTYNNRIRRVGLDGIITTVAGKGTYGYSGDGGPATQAQLNWPWGVAVGPDSSLYIADTYNERIRRVGPDGIITTVAGNGTDGYSGDGGPATQAQLYSPNEVAVGQDGSLYIADMSNQRIRRVGPDGIISSVAGNGFEGYSGDGGPATQAQLGSPWRITVGPNGDLYVSESSNYRIRRVVMPLPWFSATNNVIPAENGSELYVFDSRGRHLQTLDALTGAIRYQFSYNSAGTLSSITDRNGLVTRIERDAGGLPTAIVSPHGQRTILGVDAQGALTSLINPAGEETRFDYTPDELLAHRIDPRGGVYSYTYDTLGRLTQDTNPAGGFISLSRLHATGGYTITLSNALGVTTHYGVETLSTGDERRVQVRANGLRNEALIGTNGVRAWSLPNGDTQTVTLGPDPRWGMWASLPTSQTMTTPGGLVASFATTRTADLTNPANPLSLKTLTDTVSFNGHTYTSVYNAANRSFIYTSPLGRQSTAVIDVLFRLVQKQMTNLHSESYTYNAEGRLASIIQGSGAEARTMTVSYNSAGYPETVTDPQGRAASFARDAAGRVITQTLPGGRMIGYRYDANGNLTSIIPPGRPAHAFTYTSVDRIATYTPPNVAGTGNNLTRYLYNADKQLARIIRPDNQTIDLNYDSAGRLSVLTLTRGSLTYAYHPTTGNLTTLTAPGGINLSYTYDGSSLTNSAWSGPIAGSVSRSYDNSLRLSSLSVNGANPIAFQYDNDNLLIQAGALALSRDPQNGLLAGTTLGNVSDTWHYNGFGEPVTHSVAISGTAAYAVQYTRDQLGRIIQKAETIGGASNNFGYGYDSAGRLTTVTRNDVTIASYTYDSNGNRLSFSGPGGTIAGSYDAQDRLTQYGGASYSYTANGELLSKTTSGQTTAYQYDALGNLLAVTLPNHVQIGYFVDGQNRRIGKLVNGVLVQGFLYQDNLKPIAELDGSGNIVSRFIYASRVNVPDYLIKAGITYRLIADQLGSPRLVINTTTGQIVQSIDYDPFGNVVNDTHPGFQPFGFAGGLYDLDTRLIRFSGRDYDPETGRWTAKDPIFFRGGEANLYVYVGNNPMNSIDPRGLDLYDTVRAWYRFINTSRLEDPSKVLDPNVSPNDFAETRRDETIDLVKEAADAAKESPGMSNDPFFPFDLPTTWDEIWKPVEDFFIDWWKDNERHKSDEETTEEQGVYCPSP